MVRFAGFAMIFVAAFCVLISGKLAWAMWLMADAGIFRSSAKLEIIIVVLCGVVIPFGVGALILKKNATK